MPTHDRTRLRRAILRNALTWGAAWALTGGALVAAVNLVAPEPGVDSLVERLGVALLGAAMWGVRFGIIGAAIGTAFAAMIRLRYRGRRLADINPVRFAALGAVVGGVGVPLFLQTMNVLSGDGPIAWSLVLDDAPWASVFGAAAAAGSILLARRAGATEDIALPQQHEAAEIGTDAPELLRGSAPSRETEPPNVAVPVRRRAR